MPVNRRQFLLGMAGMASMPICSALPAAAGADSKTAHLSARSTLDGQHFISSLDASGQLRFSTPLPGRGHGVALSPDKRTAVAVARRPGQYLIVLDTQTGHFLHQIESDANRHFYGHGVFSPNGRWLFTTENDFEAGQGLIGVRDATQNFELVRSMPAHGIGPHELALLSDGKTLVVANGGIQTHPDSGRAKLNLDTMQPALTYIDAESGALLAQHQLKPEWHQNSIRHLAVTPDDQVCFVMQYQGNRTETPPLIGLHRLGEPLKLLQAPAAIHQRMRNYCGSVTIDTSGETFAVSSPRGGVISFWRTATGDFLGHLDVPDGCGIATGAAANEFWISSGLGSMLRYRLQQGTVHTSTFPNRNDMRWDNHMIHI